MSLEYRQIILERVKLPGSRVEFPEWRVSYGRVSVLLGGPESSRKGVLRVLAGLDKPLAGNIRTTGEGAEGGAGPLRRTTRTAYLPPPGEEVFAGTTAGEEIRFFSGETDDMGARLEEIEAILGTRFGTLMQRSVWELSEAERRLLLIVSQAVARPALWLIYEPFQETDARSEAGVAEFIEKAAAGGAAVVVATLRSDDALKVAHELLVLTRDGEVSYQGSVKDLQAGRLAYQGFDLALLRRFCCGESSIHERRQL